VVIQMMRVYYLALNSQTLEGAIAFISITTISKYYSIACICIADYKVPLVFPIDEGGLARVLSHLLHVCFKFVESSIEVEEEKRSESIELQQSIPVVKFVEDDGHFWYLDVGNYRAYRLTLLMLVLSTKIESHQSSNSIVDMAYMAEGIIPSPS